MLSGIIRGLRFSIIHSRRPYTVTSKENGTRFGSTPDIPIRLHLSPLRTLTSHISTLKTSRDRKSTRLNSSHSSISYAVFCLKKSSRERHVAKAAQHTEASHKRRTRPPYS